MREDTKKNLVIANRAQQQAYTPGINLSTAGERKVKKAVYIMKNYTQFIKLL